MSRDTLWQRRRDCAAAATLDAVMKRAGLDKPQGWYDLVSPSSHYNEAQDRCFVRVDLRVTHADQAHGNPLTNYYIFDAFDSTTFIECSDDENASKDYCYIALPAKEPYKDCAQCRAIVKEMMTK
jgi:hypothetical protein